MARARRRVHDVALTAGAAASGVATYAVQLLMARNLTSNAFATVGMLWTVHYLMVAIVFYPTETYVARARTLGIPTDLLRVARGALVWCLPWVAAASAVLGVRLEPSFTGVALVLMPLVIAVTSVPFYLGRGILGGSRHFRRYALATALEGLFRPAALTAGIVVLGSPVPALFGAWCIPAGSLGIVSAWRQVGRSIHQTTPRPWPGGDGESSQRFPRYMRSALSQNLTAQLFVSGSLLIYGALEADDDRVAAFFVVLTIARAPLVFLYNGLATWAVNLVVASSRGHQADAMVMRPVRRTVFLAVGVWLLAAFLAALTGPPILEGMFDLALRPRPMVVGLAASVSIVTTGGLMLGQVAIGIGREHLLVRAWGAGLGAWALSLGAAAILVDAAVALLIGAQVGAGVAVGLLARNVLFRLGGSGTLPGTGLGWTGVSANSSIDCSSID